MNDFRLRPAFIALSLFITCQLFAGSGFKVSSRELTARLSPQDEIVSLKYGSHHQERAIHGSLMLAGCHIVSAATTQHIPGNGIALTRRWASDTDSNSCMVVERIFPVGKSIRWEVEIQGTGAPWSTPIQTQFTFPDAGKERIWAPWGDPRRGNIGTLTFSQQAALGLAPLDTAWQWSDPLVQIPFVQDTLWFGAQAYSHDNPMIGFIPFQGNLISIPLVSVLERETDDGISIVLSPEDQMLDLSVVLGERGTIQFSRLFHRISDKDPVKFALDLVPHEADWRGGLRWMTERYPAYFDPVLPLAAEIAGTGAYSAHEAAFDTTKMKKMAFGVNWKASFDFPYMGMFLPPVSNDREVWQRYGGGPTSVASMAEYSSNMRKLGFHVLSYFNITEFGANVADTPPAIQLSDTALWRDCNQILYATLAGGILRVSPRSNEKAIQRAISKSHTNGPYYTWGDGIAMDPGDPAYQQFLLDQARRHMAKLPDASGICIDRMDWLRIYNQNGDDGISWFDGAPSRSLLWSWRQTLSKLGPIVHEAGKVIFVNNHDKRIDLLNQTDGFYDEFSYAGSPLNLTAFTGIRKPTLGWTGEEKNLRPDPDVFFQKYLYLGVFPTAPFPGNDHSLAPGEWVDRQYLDYGPLLKTLKGKKWVLAPHCVEVSGQRARANLFEVPGGWVIPVVFGPRGGKATVILKHVPRLSTDCSATVLYPASDTPVPIPVELKNGALQISASLVRGCALIQLRNNATPLHSSGSRIIPLLEKARYPDGRPAANYTLHVKDLGAVLKHGEAPGGCDSLGARDIWVWEDSGKYYMHYDGAGASGWVACLATSTNLTDWTRRGAVLPLGDKDHRDCASASYGVTFNDGTKWHMFYLGTPHTSPPPDLVPAFPYLTMKAEGPSPAGPWDKRYEITPFTPKAGTYYSATASPGFIVRQKSGYRMFYSASTDNPILRTIGIARTKHLDAAWSIDSRPIVPPAEQVENSSLYYQESNSTWFLFTNHVGLRDWLEYTDAIWVYWTKDLEHWNPSHKAIVLDGATCSWSRQIIGLPSVVKAGNRLAVFYDGFSGQAIPPGASSHMKRDVGLAWIDLPIITPSEEVGASTRGGKQQVLD